MRPIEDCSYRRVIRGEGPDEVARCGLVEELVLARLSRPARGGPRRRASAPDGRIAVGFVSPCGYLGGAERWHTTLIPRLDRGRFAVEGVAILYADQTHPILMDQLAGTCAVACGPEAVRDLAARVDLLVVWGIAEPGPYLPPWDARPAVVMVMHVDGRNPEARAMATRSASDVDHWACVAPSALESVPAELRDRAAVIPNGVDPERVRPTRPRADVRAEWGVAPGRRVLGYLGRISPEKNPEALAEAIASLHRQGRTEWVGVLIGDGFDPGYVASVRHGAGLKAGGDVIFTGGRTDVGDCLAAFDALLIPSHSEGCCITLIEGWMAGVPVLATRVGLAASNPELVLGLDVPCRGDDVARALVPGADLGDESAAARVGRARAFALEHLSADRFAARWSSYLHGLVGPRPPAAEPPISLDGLYAVHREACAVCCREVAPSPSTVNRVIASHVFSLAHELVRRGVRDGRDVGAAVALKHWAVPHLRRIPGPEDEAPAPVPNVGPCFHLGDRTGWRECPTCQGSVRLKVYACHHVLHDDTTAAQCRSCPDFDARLGRGSVRTWAVGVTTAPRRSPTLERCLASLARAGWAAPRLFAEPGVDVPSGFPRVTITRRDRRIGEWPNWYLGLAELVQRHPSADAYMMVQDDTIFCRNVRAFLEADLWPAPRLGLVSVYCPEPYARDASGWHRVGGENGVVGALAFILPSAAAHVLLAHPRIVDRRRRGKDRGLVDTDGAVGRWAWQSRLPTYYLSPSLAQHIGDTSTVWPGAANAGLRSSSNFVGEDFDARRLLARPAHA